MAGNRTSRSLATAAHARDALCGSFSLVLVGIALDEPGQRRDAARDREGDVRKRRDRDSLRSSFTSRSMSRSDFMMASRLGCSGRQRAMRLDLFGAAARKPRRANDAFLFCSGQHAKQSAARATRG